MQKKNILSIVGAEVLLLTIIGGVVSYQVRLVERKITEMADLKDPSPFTASLIGHLNRISLHLLGYGHNRDGESLQHIANVEKDFESSLVEFQKFNPRLFPSTAETRIWDAYQPFKDAVQDSLQAIDAQAKRWQALLDADDQIIFIFEHRLRPIVRGNQDHSTERMDLILNLENEMRAIPKDLTQYILNHSNDSEPGMKLDDHKFETLLRLYLRIAPLTTERRQLGLLSGLWASTVVLAQDIRALEKTKTESFAKVAQSNQNLQTTISAVLPAVRPEVIERKKNAIFHSITLLLVVAGLMVLGAVLSCVLAGVSIYRRTRESAREINRLTGDLRRSEERVSELGHLMETSGDAAIGMNLQGTISRWNGNAEKMYGYSPEDIMGKSIAILFASEREIGQLQQKFKESKQVAFDSTHVRKNGEKITVHLIFSRLQNGNGQITGISLLARLATTAAKAA